MLLLLLFFGPVQFYKGNTANTANYLYFIFRVTTVTVRHLFYLKEHKRAVDANTLAQKICIQNQ